MRDDDDDDDEESQVEAEQGGCRTPRRELSFGTAERSRGPTFLCGVLKPAEIRSRAHRLCCADALVQYFRVHFGYMCFSKLVAYLVESL